MPEAFTQMEGEYVLDEYHLYKLDDVTMTKFGVFVTDEGVVLESAGGTGFLLNYIMYKLLRAREHRSALDLFSARPVSDSHEIDRVLAPLFGVFSSNYYHWTLQFLPKLRAFEYYRTTSGEAPRILLQPNAPD